MFQCGALGIAELRSFTSLFSWWSGEALTQHNAAKLCARRANEREMKESVVIDTENWNFRYLANRRMRLEKLLICGSEMARTRLSCESSTQCRRVLLWRERVWPTPLVNELISRPISWSIFSFNRYKTVPHVSCARSQVKLVSSLQAITTECDSDWHFFFAISAWLVQPVGGTAVSYSLSVMGTSTRMLIEEHI